MPQTGVNEELKLLSKCKKRREGVGIWPRRGGGGYELRISYCKNEKNEKKSGGGSGSGRGVRVGVNQELKLL